MSVVLSWSHSEIMVTVDLFASTSGVVLQLIEPLVKIFSKEPL